MKLIFFRCYSKWSELVCQLSDEEAGRVFKSALQYAAGEDIREISGRENIVYSMVRQSIDAGAQIAAKRKSARGGAERAEACSKAGRAGACSGTGRSGARPRRKQGGLFMRTKETILEAMA